MQGTPRSAPSWILHMRKCAAHPISALGIAQRYVINGAVHSKYTEEKSSDSFCEPDSEKNSVSEGSSFRLL